MRYTNANSKSASMFLLLCTLREGMLLDGEETLGTSCHLGKFAAVNLNPPNVQVSKYYVRSPPTNNITSQQLNRMTIHLTYFQTFSINVNFTKLKELTFLTKSNVFTIIKFSSTPLSIIVATKIYSNNTKEIELEGEALLTMVFDTYWGHGAMGGDMKLFCKGRLGVSVEGLGEGTSGLDLGARTIYWKATSLVFIPRFCFPFTYGFLNFLGHFLLIVYHINIILMQVYWTSMCPNMFFIYCI